MKNPTSPTSGFLGDYDSVLIDSRSPWGRLGLPDFVKPFNSVPGLAAAARIPGSLQGLWVSTVIRWRLLTWRTSGESGSC